MGTTSEKLTYLNETKQELKQKINNLGGSIDNNTTFRNYANQLQNVYDNLPKTEYQTGTEINLGKTIKGKLDFDNGVVGIGQSSQDSTQGYQLLNITATSGTKNGATWVVNEDKSITISTSGATTGVVTIPVVTSKTLEAGTYYMSGMTGGTENTYFFGILVDNPTQWVVRNYNGVTQFSVSEQKTYRQIWVVIATGTTISTPITVYPMISKTNTSNYEQYTGGQASPNPSYPQTINSVTGNQDVVVSGKNKFNPDATGLFKLGCSVSESDGEITITATQNGDIYVGNVLSVGSTYDTEKGKKIYVKPNTRYTIVSTNNNVNKILFTEFDSNNISLGYIQNTTITTQTNTSYITIRYGLENAVNGTSYKTKIMVAEGTDTTYEPYITPTSYQLSLGDKKLYDECTIVGSPDNWKFVDNYYKEKISIINRQGSNTSGKFRFVLGTTYNAKGAPNSSVADIYSNILTKSSANNNYLRNNGIAINDVGQILIYWEDWAEYSIQEMQNYFANRDDYIVYPLATSIETPITDETLISQLNNWYNAHSNNGTTIITSNGNLPMIIKCRGLKGE